MSESSTDFPVRRFLERARLEAERYGSDPWVFVRELLQNSRDAGARRIAFTTYSDSGLQRLACRDDGEGMSFAHARRFLFPLYASSKNGRGSAAGKFGVGFWSVLRFHPTRIVIRSWPRDEEPWEVSLDGDLAEAEAAAPAPASLPGTEVVLERSARGRGLAKLVTEAVRHGTRDLRQRDAPQRRVVITVDGMPIRTPFELEAPSSAFRRGRLKGVVGLGSHPRAELFSKGLRVRHAAYLRDLLVSGTTSPRPQLGEGAGGPEGLAPRALLEGESLEPLLARTDVHENRELRRLVRLAQAETERLIRRQLDRDRPRSAWQRIADAIREVPPLAGVTLLMSALVAVTLLWAGRGWLPRRSVEARGASELRAARSTGPYRDLAGLYGGPDVESLDRSYRPIDLRYEPPEDELSFAALIVGRIDEQGRARGTAADDAWSRLPRSSSPCTSGCTRVTLRIADGPGYLRVPVATGYRVDPGSVTLEDRAQIVYLSPHGQPAIRLGNPTAGRLRYTIHAAPPGEAVWPLPRPLELPRELIGVARSLQTLPIDERVARASDWVGERIRYSRSREIVALHNRSRSARTPFLERALAIGAGDCDVQNAVLQQLLQAAGVGSRLAIGYLGSSGRVAPWLHAWIEFQDGSGIWHAADASRSAPPLATTSVVAGDVGPLTGPVASGEPSPTSAPGEGLSAGSAPPVRAPPTLLGPLSVGLLLGVTALAVLGAVFLRRTRRSERLDERHDLSRLLQGALQHPDAFRDVPAIFHRRLVPLLGRGVASLAEVWHLAAKGRLYRTRTGGALATKAAARGLRVVDTRPKPGEVVADALGAFDLDAWQALFARSRSTPLLEAAASHLRHFGERLELLAGRTGGVASLAALLELPADRFLSRPERWIVIDAGAPWLVEAEKTWASRPAEALFDVVDRVLDLLASPEVRRCRLLMPLAEAALRENR